jgi:hypothetical protein
MGRKFKSKLQPLNMTPFLKIGLWLGTWAVLSACHAGADSPDALAEVISKAVERRDIRMTQDYLVNPDDMLYMGRGAGKTEAELAEVEAMFKKDPDQMARTWDADWTALMLMIEEAGGNAKAGTAHVEMESAPKLEMARITIPFRVQNGVVEAMVIGLHHGKWKVLPRLNSESRVIGER